jgi:PAS domain S-box-containing protein
MSAPSNPVVQSSTPPRVGERYEKIFQNASIGIAITDCDGRFEHCNPAYCQLLGYSMQELRALDFAALVHADDRAANLRAINSLKSGEMPAVEIENRYALKDGTLLRVKKHVSILHDESGRPARLLALVTDISAQQHVQALQQRHHDTFYRLIERNPFGVYVVDADFTLREVSLGAQSVFAKVQPLIGRDFVEVLHQLWPDPFATEAIARFQHTLQTGQAYAAPSTVQQRQDIDDVEAYDWRIERMVLPDGRFGVVCYFYDLSARQRWETQLRESEDRFRAMADGVPLIVWVHDAAGKLVFVNETYCSFFGVTREEMRDARWRLLTHPEDGNTYADEFMACVRERRSFHREVRVRRADRAWRWMESWAQPRFAADGAYLGHVGTSADITLRKEAEQSLREADLRKNEFLATLTHELRNPLAPIRNAVQILNHPNVSQDEATLARQMIDRQSLALVRLVDDLMDVSRIAHGKLQLRREPVSLVSIIEQAVEAVRPFCDQASLQLQVKMPSRQVMVQADPLRLTQVFANVLNNACKYTEPGGHIWLVATQQGSSAQVTVRDDGIGVSPEQLPRIFEMFVQDAPALSRSKGGLGIGLALARSLVQAHGGTIEARSEGPGRGAEFIVVVPVFNATAKRNDHIAQPDHTLTPSAANRVLVVEDNPDGATSLAALLRLKGFDVTVVNDGVAALTAAADGQPDIVLLDLGLPQMNGFDVCRTLRARPEGAQATIVAISGWGQESDRRDSALAGFDAHLIKPVEIEALLRVLWESARKLQRHH